MSIPIEKCQNCGEVDGDELHQCPLISAGGDSDYLCNCCKACTIECDCGIDVDDVF